MYMVVSLSLFTASTWEIDAWNNKQSVDLEKLTSGIFMPGVRLIYQTAIAVNPPEVSLFLFIEKKNY